MNLYNTNNGTVIEANGDFYAVKAEWEKLINDDNAFQSATALIKDATAENSTLVEELLPVIGNNQELWACGVLFICVAKSEDKRKVKMPAVEISTVVCMKPKGPNVFSKVRHTV
mgnify:CR=1 FL=1